MGEIICSHCGKEESLCICVGKITQEELREIIACEICGWNLCCDGIPTLEDSKDSYICRGHLIESDRVINKIKELGYRKSAELKILTDDEIERTLLCAEYDGANILLDNLDILVKTLSSKFKAQLEADRRNNG